MLRCRREEGRGGGVSRREIREERGGKKRGERVEERFARTGDESSRREYHS